MIAMRDTWDAVIVGAGAAGLMAAIQAGRAGLNGRVLVLDGARTLGAKILVAGGGRCNVTHDRVDETAFSGSTPPAIRNVLRRFDVGPTVDFFREIGVELKREYSGKLFPITDSARTVLNALLGAAAEAGVTIAHPRRVGRIARDAAGGFVMGGDWGSVKSRRIVLATGGCSLPRTGSDGAGHALARALGHTITSHVFPALVPLVVADGHSIRSLSGLSADVEAEVRSGSGRRLARMRGSALCTHFGLSGPAILDISRHLIRERYDDPESGLVINWLPDVPAEELDAQLCGAGHTSVGRVLRAWLPGRLAEALCHAANVDASGPAHGLTRERRRALVQTVSALPVPVAGNRGWNHAEVTAGGVPLREVHLRTMESRMYPGLHLCGEICDVDGRIGGYNFQWAWASGYVAGTSIAREIPDIDAA